VGLLGNNCIRGGFVCEGYSTRTSWHKPPGAKPPILLQSKDGFGEPQASVPYPTATVYTGHPQPNPRLEPSPVSFRRPGSNSAQGVSGRPILIDDDREAQMTSPQHQAPPLDKSATGPGFIPNHLPKADFNRVPPLHDMPRPGEPASATSAVATRPMVQTPQATSPQTPHQAQAQVQAQLALQHQASLRRPKTEKEKMLAGELYYAYVPELVDERERCKAACWRFNNSTNPNLGVSRDERSRLFRAILQPKEIPSTLSIATPTSPVGSVGENVVVEAPFTCDYGYNISLGNDVCIGANCTIMDTCSVSIGARCILGPNVSIYSATLPIDPRRRKGSQGPSLGRGIIIEDDCWIGGGVTILYVNPPGGNYALGIF
jgi:acetyltransferase-like isoleucine patch superfamily enzyme